MLAEYDGLPKSIGTTTQTNTGMCLHDSSSSEGVLESLLFTVLFFLFLFSQFHNYCKTLTCEILWLSFSMRNIL